jgi:hypothetical protein
MSDDVGGADVRDRVLAGGARAMAKVRSRTAAPPPPPAALPLPRPVDRFATARRCPERRVRNAAHHRRRSGCCWRDQREDLGVGPFVRVIIQEAHPLAWSIACGGLRVGRTRRGQHGPWSARHGGRQGAAARRHREQQQLSTWCTGRGGEAAGDERAAGRRQRTLARHPSTRAACVHALRAAARVQVAKGKRLCRVRDAAAASGGPAAEDISAPPKHKGRLARAIGSVASRAYLLRRQQGGSPTRRDLQDLRR